MNKEIPLKWEPRSEQITILDKFKLISERKKKFLVVEAPTGTGKSFAIVMMANYLQNIHEDMKFDIITNTKQLQDQYVNDFSFIKELKGKENYICHKAGKQISCSQGMEMNKLQGTTCNICSYRIAYTSFISSQIGIMNYSLFFAFFVYAEDILTNRNARVLFIDEAHLFEEAYTRFVESYLSISYLASLDVEISSELSFEFSVIKNKKQFAEFMRKFVIPSLLNSISRLTAETEKERNINKNAYDINKLRVLSRTKCKFNRFLSDESNWNSNWVFEKGKDNKGEGYCRVDVVWSTKYLKEIWDRYDHVVLLSGTILNKTLFSRMLDIPKDDVKYTTVESPFKPKNRLIYYFPVAKMSYVCLEESYKLILPEIKKLIRKHKGQKGIIHTGNYRLSKWLENDIKELDLTSRLVFHETNDRQSQLNIHLGSDNDTIIVSPSMVNGVDLKDGLSRFQIIMKIPYPALDTEQVKARRSQDNSWYSWKTLCDVIQSYGRSVRSEEDWAVTYILDSNFSILTRNIDLPEYIKEALIEIDDLDQITIKHS